MKSLSSHEAEKLLKQYGPNLIEQKKKVSFLQLFLGQLNNFLTILLITATVLSFVIGEGIDGALILSIVILNAMFGIYQEKKAEEAIEALTQMSITKVRVIRDGREKEIDSHEIVPGDTVYIEEGSKVPADGMIIDTSNLEINEASLTGESLPVPKITEEEVFMGTIVSKGRAHIKILKTGNATKFGQIAADLSTIESPKTPLQKKLESLSKLIGIIGIVASGIVFLLSIVQGSTIFSSFLLAISLAVAVVPEGLPAVLTLTLSIGVKEMAKHKAIVRKLSAVEAFGSVTLIATDKTGTLTTNKMTVKEIFVNDKMSDVGAGSSGPSLGIKSTTEQSGEKTSPLQQLLLCGILCSTASLVPVHESKRDEFDVLGDPTEGALLMLAQQMDYDIDTVRKEWTVVEEKPFDSVTKLMSVVVKSVNVETRLIASLRIYTKGAPESVLDLCSSIMVGDKVEHLNEEKKQELHTVLKNWAQKGLRVLAFSYKTVGAGSSGPSLGSKSNMGQTGERTSPLQINDSIFLGMVAIHDAPRPEVKEAIEKAHLAGIRVVMITGDNEITAEAIGVSIGLLQTGGEIITGAQLDSYTDEVLLEKLPATKIFARTSPFHKRRIVELYQKLGEIVAVTGDGVNDSIALKQADVGLAMGLIGTDVARETADIVIADDNFATIVNAVEEGRNIVRHLKNSIIYLLACNIAEAVALIVGLALQLPHIFYPIQFLYINLVTDGVPALAFAYASREDGLMRKPPEKLQTLLKKKDILYIVFVGIFGTALVFIGYYVWSHLATFGENAHTLGTTAAFTILALIQSFIFIDIWLDHRSLLSHFNKLFVPIFFVAFLIPFILQAAIVHIPVVAQLFKVTTLYPIEFIILVLVSSVILAPITILNKWLKTVR